MNNPLLLGFIVDIENVAKYNLFKMAMVELIEKNLSPGDRAYYYSSKSDAVPNRATEIISSVLTLRCFNPVNIAKAMEATVDILGGEVLEDYRRIIFVLSDRFDGCNEFMCARAIRLDQREGFNSTFVLCDFSDLAHKFTIDHANVVCWHFPIVEDFKSKIIEFVRG